MGAPHGVMLEAVAYCLKFTVQTNTMMTIHSIAKYLISSIVLCIISVIFISVACNKETAIPPLTYCCSRDPIDKSIGNAHVYLPNVFTPNNDNINDILFVQGDSITKVDQIYISNKDGIAFYRSNFPPNNPEYGWDGTVNGIVEQGSYTVTIDVRTIEGLFRLHGFVCSLPCSDEMKEDMFDNLHKCRFGDQFNGTVFDSTLVTAEMLDCF